MANYREQCVSTTPRLDFRSFRNKKHNLLCLLRMCACQHPRWDDSFWLVCVFNINVYVGKIGNLLRISQCQENLREKGVVGGINRINVYTQLFQVLSCKNLL